MMPRPVNVTAANIVRVDRAPRGGVHLSDIIHHIRQRFDEKFKNDLPGSEYHRWQIGLSWEAAALNKGLAYDLKEHHAHMFQQYQFEDDGITMTADGVCPECRLVWETKATWYGSGRDITDPVFRFYIWQTQCYTRAAKFKTGRFVFAYMNGDYRANRNPTYKAWDWTWTKAELNKTWELIRRERDAMLKEKEDA